MQRLNCEFELKFASDGAKEGTFAGYGSVFNIVDAGGDSIAPGAFKKTLKEWGARKKYPKMLLQHGGFIGPAEDGIPVGKYTKMEEDDHGLYVEGELFALDTQKGRYIHEGMKSGELDGLSIGYQAIDVSYGKTPDEPRRTLKQIKLFELSIVTFPMNQESRVTDAKAVDLIKSLSDAEDYLRDACGFSRAQARAFVSTVKGIGLRDADPPSLDALEAIQRLKSSIAR